MKKMRIQNQNGSQKSSPENPVNDQNINKLLPVERENREKRYVGRGYSRRFKWKTCMKTKNESPKTKENKTGTSQVGAIS